MLNNISIAKKILIPIAMVAFYMLIFSSKENLTSLNHRGFLLYYGTNDFGTKGELNPAEGLKLWKEAAERGLIRAKHNVGVAYHDGIATPRDDVIALQWFKKAAEANYPPSQYNTGVLLSEANPPRYEEAMVWYRKAAEQNFINAFPAVGNLYSQGKGVEKNMIEAVKWYRAGAERGDSWCYNNLAISYLRGEGIEKNALQAHGYFLKAAEQGNILAMRNLGYMYYNGIGVAKDENKAIAWFSKAGDPSAQFILGYAMIFGQEDLK